MNINYPLLIDGGLSNVLENEGCDLNHKLWSAHVLESDPEAIIQVHLVYLRSGAQCITTSSYQATIQGFIDVGYNKNQAESYILKSVELAEEAIIRFKRNNKNVLQPLIAASIGPYGAYLADGSEYRGNYGLTNEELQSFHQSRIDLLNRSNADILACETIPSFQEIKVLASILKETKKPAWISFSCKDEKHINDGTAIEECAAYLSSHPRIFAIGVNCTSPEYISGIIKSIQSGSPLKKIVVYPNSGEAYNARSKTWIGVSDPKLFIEMAKEWLELGADIIGGCCRIGPAHIAQLARLLKSR